MGNNLWTYSVKSITISALQNVLREYGKWGWELVQILDRDPRLELVFKRPLEWRPDGQQ
jgi:hypothetical protein